MARKYHYYTLQTNPRYREKETRNTCHKASGRPLKESNQVCRLKSFLELLNEQNNFVYNFIITTEKHLILIN